MWLQLFVVCCIFVQSIHGSNDRSTNEILKLPPNITLMIVGGDVAPDGLAPFQCSYQIGRRHFCGCAIMNSNFVITASHCIIGRPPGKVSILVGTNHLSSGGTYYETERLIPHEHYDDPDAANDIALVKVIGSIEFNENVQPIELDRKEVTPNDLRYVNLYVIDWYKCNSTNLGKLGLLHEGHFCTNGVEGTGVCKGDSGGPITYEGRLVGIVNFGIPCAHGIPDAFAKISYYLDWITKHSSISPQLASSIETK